MPGAEDRGSTPGRAWPKSLQLLVTDSLPNARQQVCPRRWPLLKVGLCRSRYGTSKIPHCHECRAKFAVLHHQWWRLQVRKILEWSEKKTPNKQTNIPCHRNLLPCLGMFMSLYSKVFRKLGSFNLDLKSISSLWRSHNKKMIHLQKWNDSTKTYLPTSFWWGVSSFSFINL